MGEDISFLFLQGELLDRLDDIFARFDYRSAEADTAVTSATGLQQALEEDTITPYRVRKVVCRSQGWTVIFDREMIMWADDEVCSALSREYATSLVGLLSEESAASYGYTLYEDGRCKRKVLSCAPPELDDEDLAALSEAQRRGIVDDEGEPLTGEAGIDVGELSKAHLVTILNKEFNLDFDKLFTEDRYLVKVLDE